MLEIPPHIKLYLCQWRANKKHFILHTQKQKRRCLSDNGVKKTSANGEAY